MKTLDINAKAVFLLRDRVRIVATGRSGYRLDLTIETAGKDALGETTWTPQTTYEYDRNGALIGHHDEETHLLATALGAAIDAGQDVERQLTQRTRELAEASKPQYPRDAIDL